MSVLHPVEPKIVGNMEMFENLALKRNLGNKYVRVAYSKNMRHLAA